MGLSFAHIIYLMTSCNGTSSSGGEIVDGKKSTPMHGCSDVVDNTIRLSMETQTFPRRHGKLLIVLVIRVHTKLTWFVLSGVSFVVPCSWHIRQQTELCPEGKDMG